MPKTAIVTWLVIIAFFLIVYWIGFLNIVLFFVLCAAVLYLLPWLAALVFTFIYIRRR